VGELPNLEDDGKHFVGQCYELGMFSIISPKNRAGSKTQVDQRRRQLTVLDRHCGVTSRMGRADS